MAIDDLHFIKWFRKNSTEILESDLRTYNGAPITEGDAFLIYDKLKITEVDVRGYDAFFTTELRAEHFLSLDEVIKQVSEDIIDTAVVIRIRHKNWLDSRDIHIENPLYKAPNNINNGIAQQYLKNNRQD